MGPRSDFNRPIREDDRFAGKRTKEESIKSTKKIAKSLGCHPDDLLKVVWD
jgi:hypothetical protein